MTQIAIEDVSKTYGINNGGIHAVSRVSMKIEKGEFISLIGHSGSGKTTLLSLLGGMVRPTTGKIVFEGRDIYSLDSDGLSEYRSEKIGFIFQCATLLSVLTVKENLVLPVLFKIQKNSIHESAQRALELLRMVGLSDKVDAYPSQLSGGQQRRVAIARAFMNDPGLILADEPTGDLDEETEADMMRFFQEMNRMQGVTFVIATHNTDLARQAKRQLKMRNGSVQQL